MGFFALCSLGSCDSPEMLKEPGGGDRAQMQASSLQTPVKEEGWAPQVPDFLPLPALGCNLSWGLGLCCWLSLL